MFCPNCGAAIQTGIATCQNCGTDLRQFISQHTPAPVPPPMPAVPLPPSPLWAAGTQRSGMPVIGVVVIVGGVLFFVLAVLGILAAIAIPDFLKFQAGAKQMDAKVNLKGIFAAEAAYYADYGRYGATFTQIQWTDQGSNYAYFLQDQAVQPRIGGPYELPAEVKPSVSKDGFTAVAVGNVDNDETLDVWTIDDSKQLRNVSNDTMN